MSEEEIYREQENMQREALREQENEYHYQQHLLRAEQDPISTIASMAEQINQNELEIISLKKRIEELEKLIK